MAVALRAGAAGAPLPSPPGGPRPLRVLAPPGGGSIRRPRRSQRGSRCIQKQTLRVEATAICNATDARMLHAEDCLIYPERMAAAKVIIVF